MNDDVKKWLDQCPMTEPIDNRQKTWLLHADDDAVVQLLDWLRRVDRHPDSMSQPTQRSLLRTLVERELKQSPGKRELPEKIVSNVMELYQILGKDSHIRHELLCLLATGNDRKSITSLAELLAEDPPNDARNSALPFVTLLQRPGDELQVIFPKLLAGLQHRQIAAPILDLANYLVRRKMVSEHPAKARGAQLSQLLDGLAQKLVSLKITGEESESSLTSQRDKVAESVSLVVSICDTLAMITDPAAIEPLKRAAELPHRRIRVEATYAIASLGDIRAMQQLVELASEPVVRLRVLAYASELGVLDQVKEEYRSDQARAESELMNQLAAPTSMGIAPSECELIDQRDLYWPGYNEPVTSFLFRYKYRHPEGNYSNIGIAGPLAHSFTVDLNDLSTEDIYAVFAGWQAEHEEIQEQDVTHLNELQLVDVARLKRRLNDSGFENIVPTLLGIFFGEKVLIAHCEKEGILGVAAADSENVIWLPSNTTRRPFGPAEIYSLYKGRKLLRFFNE